MLDKYIVTVDGHDMPIDFTSRPDANAARRALRESPDYADCVITIRREPYTGASETSLDGGTKALLDSDAGFYDVLSHWAATGHLPAAY